MPRLSPCSGSCGVAKGIGALLVLAAAGAALVHIVEYHLGLGGNGQHMATIQFMLAHCPVRGALLVVLVAVMLTAFALFRELRVLWGRQRSLAQAARRAGVVTSPPPGRPPLHAARFVALFLPILAGQLGLTALVARFLPMTFAMDMHGVSMDMSIQPALPMLPLQLIVALLLAAFAWRLERRFITLHTLIATVCRLLMLALGALLRVSIPSFPSLPRPSRYGGPTTLSRPPPA
jgi:hypothetical protein